jgi:hypothetical protein
MNNTLLHTCDAKHTIKIRDMNDLGSPMDLTHTLEELLTEPREWRRPRVFFNISPSKTHSSNLYDVILRNSGGSPAFNITCLFDPDLPYGKDSSLSKLNVFRDLGYLERGDEIRFFFESAVNFLNDPNFPKKTKVKIEYNDSAGISFTDTYVVDLERLRDTYMLEEYKISDIPRELANIRRRLESIERRGLQIKTLDDERRGRESWIRRSTGQDNQQTRKKENKRQKQK